MIVSRLLILGVLWILLLICLGAASTMFDKLRKGNTNILRDQIIFSCAGFCAIGVFLALLSSIITSLH